MRTDLSPIRTILTEAAKEDRYSLLEHEVYECLAAAGCDTPAFVFLRPGDQIRDDQLRRLGSDTVMVKVVSTDIAHKTDVGGVKRVAASVEAVQQALSSMHDSIPGRFAQWLKRHPDLVPSSYCDKSDDAIAQEVRSTIRGYLVVQAVRCEGSGPGAELLIGLRHNREFGPVLTMGVGGVDTEMMGAACKKGEAVVNGSALLLDDAGLLSILRPTLSYRRLSGQTRGGRQLVSDEQIAGLLGAFRAIAQQFGSDGEDGKQEFTITELEVNPFAASSNKLVALDGLLKFRPRASLPAKRPQASLHALLRPSSIAVMGVSTKGMNMGRIILRNVLEAGFDSSRTWVVHPGAQEIDDVLCVPSVQALPERVDVFVLAVNADQVPDVVEALAEHDKATGVILIAGGMGEKAGGESIEDRVKKAIGRARLAKRPLVVNGGNSLGIVSRPGHYHTLFIAKNKLPLRQDGKSNIAFLSQSGAYMISRMSKLDWMTPRYAISTGNQTDLTVSDYLLFLADDPGVHTFAVYVEGFRDGDGLELARAVREVVARGRDVVFYKAGRTTEGKSATSGHTASLAGEYDVCEAIVRQAGAYVARGFNEYLDLMKMSSLMGHKEWGGNRMAAMSNAGYEAVGIADSVRGEGWDLQLATLAPETRERLQKALVLGKLDGLVDVRNPLDITPMANDAAHEDVVQAFLNDPGVDMVLCASVPLTPAIASLAEGVPEEQSIRAPGSVVNRLARVAARATKPVVACVDSGVLFDPMVKMLEECGVPTFRSADEAVRTMGLYATRRRVF